uniref:Uncharacterized protein n=1 Tax=Arundo donax TaxID=35708 RepID=A0A0A9GBG3_ARUDO
MRRRGGRRGRRGGAA